MIKRILLLTLMFQVIYAQPIEYIIKIASYKSLSALEKQIDKLPSSLIDNTMVMHLDNLHKAFYVEKASKIELEKTLKIYRKVFKDAYLMQRTNAPKAMSRPSKKINKTTVIPPITIKRQPDTQITVNTTSKNEQSSAVKNNEINATINKPLRVSNIKVYDDYDPLNFKNKTFYIVPNKAESSLKNSILMTMSFGEDEVEMIQGNKQNATLTLNYIRVKNRIYLYRGNRPDPRQYIKIESIFFEYYKISKWVQNKKITTLRYYKNKALADAYVKTF